MPTDGPSIGPIRTRLDDMARADLNRDITLGDLDTKMVILEYSQSVAEQRMAAMVGDINMSLSSLRNSDQATLAREQLLRAQLDDMWQRMEAGLCQCPAGCPGRCPSQSGDGLNAPAQPPVT